MGLFRRVLSIGLGLAAAAAAVKMLKEYGSDGHIEGEYVEVPLQNDAGAETQDVGAETQDAGAD